jgi:hypothetical protein
VEIDLGRQGAKEAAKGYERQLNVLRAQIAHSQGERAKMKQQLQDFRAGPCTSIVGRAQLEKRLATLTAATMRAARATSSKSGNRRTARTKPDRDRQ